MGSKERIANVYESLIAGDIETLTHFGFERSRTAGIPIAWEDRIIIRGNGQAFYTHLRSQVDGGDEPIGKWSDVIDTEVIKELAIALRDVQFHTINSEAISPGEEVIKDVLITKDASYTVILKGESNMVMDMAPVDVILRRIANILVSRGRGAALNIELEVNDFPEIKARIILRNVGDKDILLPNPLKNRCSDRDYLRVEIGPVQQVSPGVTAPDVIFEPLKLPVSEDIPTPWDDDYLYIGAGKLIAYPIIIPVMVPDKQRYIIRAVYSNYCPDESLAGFDIIRGRVFSREVECAG